MSSIDKVNDTLPDWVKGDIFEKILKEKVPNYKKVTSFKASPAISAGENYVTIMLRISFELELQDGTLKKHSFMMKINHDNEMSKMLLSKHNFFDVERGMYLDIVSDFEDMYKQAGVNVKLGPESYHLDTDENYVLLEDLSTRGFKNVNRLEGFDMEHTKCVLKKLALWHAASAVRVQTKGQYEKMYTIGFFHKTNLKFLKQMQESTTPFFLESIKTLNGHQIYYEALEKAQNRFVNAFERPIEVDPSEFNVLNHGDCWSNNIMFQYDEARKIKETYLVDYQTPRYGSPAQDLLYLLLSSVQYELKVSQFDYFIKFYHDYLVENLQLLNYSASVPTLKDLHMSLIKHGIWGMFTVNSVMAAVLVDPSEKATLENFVGDTSDALQFRKLMYTNDRYRKHAELVIPWMFYRGDFNL